MLRNPAEIADAQLAELARPRPDLVRLIELAVWRQRLTDRVPHLPPDYPVALAWLGELDGAVQLARALPRRADRGEALRGLVEVLALAGALDHLDQLVAEIEDRMFERARALIAHGEALVRAGEYDRGVRLALSAEQPDFVGNALDGMAELLVRAGQYDLADRLIEGAGFDRVGAVLRQVRVLVEVGEYDRAERTAAAVDGSHEQARARIEVATALSGLGEHRRAEQVRHTLTDPPRALALLGSVLPLVRAGEVDRAREAVGEAERLDASNRSGLAVACAELGEYDRAESLARSAVHENTGWVMKTVVAGFARAGHHDLAERLVFSLADPRDRAGALTALVTVLNEQGEHDRADQLVRDYDEPAPFEEYLLQFGAYRAAERRVRTMMKPVERARALAELARALAGAGEHDRATALLEEVEWLADVAVAQPGPVVAAVARALVAAGQGHRAVKLSGRAVRLLSDDRHQAGWRQGWADLATVSVHADEPGHTVMLVMSDVLQQIAMGNAQVRALVAVGEPDRAVARADEVEELAQTITDPAVRVRVVNDLVAAAALGRREHLLGLVARAERLLPALGGRPERDRATGELVTALGRAGERAAAERLAGSIAADTARAVALTALVTALAELGEYEQAADVAVAVERLLPAVDHPDVWALLVAELLEPLARAGRRDHATVLADDAERRARAVDGPAERAWRFVGLAAASARAGAHDRAAVLADDAEQLVEELRERSVQARETSEVMAALARPGDDRVAERDHAAERSAQAVRESGVRARLTGLLAGVLVQLGEHDRAERLVDEIDRPVDRAAALTTLAGALARAGEPDRARSALAAVLAHDDWHRFPFDLAAEVAPEVLVRLAELIRLPPPAPSGAVW